MDDTDINADQIDDALRDIQNAKDAGQLATAWERFKRCVNERALVTV